MEMGRALSLRSNNLLDKELVQTHFSCDYQSEDRGMHKVRAKSRDHEIMRAQKKVFKGRPSTPPKSCNVVMDSPV